MLDPDPDPDRELDPDGRASFGVSSRSLRTPTYTWRVVSRSEGLVSHSLALPLDWQATD
jgi:hypothetical protein